MTAYGMSCFVAEAGVPAVLVVGMLLLESCQCHVLAALTSQEALHTVVSEGGVGS